MPDLDSEIRGKAGGGNPDAEIRGVPGLQFFVFLFCFVFFIIYLSPSRLSLVMGSWFGLEIRGGGGRAPSAPPLDPPLQTINTTKM